MCEQAVLATTHSLPPAQGSAASHPHLFLPELVSLWVQSRGEYELPRRRQPSLGGESPNSVPGCGTFGQHEVQHSVHVDGRQGDRPHVPVLCPNARGDRRAPAPREPCRLLHGDSECTWTLATVSLKLGSACTSSPHPHFPFLLPPLPHSHPTRVLGAQTYCF